MNTPNKLTLLRIILVPVFTAFLLLPDVYFSYLWAGLVFGIAAVTDYFDGKIARKNNLITDFGKLMDPVADKLLVAAAFICFIETGLASSWVLIIVLAREFLVTSVRMVSAGRGIVIAANMWGKCKTVSQIIAVVLVMVMQFILQAIRQCALPAEEELFVQLTNIFNITGQAAIWISAVFTLISGIVYVWQSRELFKDIK